jgi:phage shock protein PspC (stress-responsive transcriptional regulator)
MKEEQKKLTRSKKERIFFGVCGGIAHFFGIDPTFVRLAFLLLAFMNGLGFWLYVILLIIVPEEAGNGTAIDGGRKENLRTMANDIKGKAETFGEKFEICKGEKGSSTRNLFGVLIVLIGLMFLINQFFPEQQIFQWYGRFLWPIVAILLGVFIIVRK